MKFFLGVDCGATSTRAFLVDSTARRGGCGVSGPRNPQHATPDELRAQLGEAIAMAANADAPECAAVFSGIAGVTSESHRKAFRGHLAACGLSRAQIAVDHDLRIALAGAQDARATFRAVRNLRCAPARTSTPRRPMQLYRKRIPFSTSWSALIVLGVVSIQGALPLPARTADDALDAARDRIVDRHRRATRTLPVETARPRYIPLPPGAVRPEGWLRDWAQAAAAGITGHLDERAAVFAEAYKATDFQAEGVKPHGTGWPLEQGAYWLDGLVRLAFILDDETLIRKARSRLDLVVEGVHRGGDSLVYWRPREILADVFNNWAHSHIGRALVAYYQATGDARILDALVKVYRDYPLPKLPAGFERVNGMVNLDPMLDTYMLSGERKILDNILEAIRDPAFVEVVDQWSRGQFTAGHAVIFYEHIRVPALSYPWVGDENLLAATLSAIDFHDKHHLLPLGLCSGEEHQAGIGVTRNVETCNVAAAAWTYHWLLRITGQRDYGDRMEQIFFNAGPAPIARDFQTMSYYQCANRLSADLPDSNDEPRNPRGRGSYRFTPIGHAVLCCVGNLNRVLPNYIQQMWMATPDGGLAATLYGPCRVRTVVNGAVPVVIESRTEYPFDATVQLIVTPEKETSFPLELRIPQWCAKPTAQINGRPIEIATLPTGFARLTRSWRPGDTVTMHFPMQPRLVRGRETPYPDTPYFNNEGNRKLAAVRAANSPFASIVYGPLVFALPIPDEDCMTPMPGAKWNYALDIDASRLNDEVQVARLPMPAHWSWQLDAVPVQLRVPVREFDWNPEELQPLPRNPVAGGRRTEITLVPYGCTKFRVSMFPVTQKTWQHAP